MRARVLSADYTHEEHIGVAESYLRWRLRSLGAELVDHGEDVTLITATSGQLAGRVRRLARGSSSSVILGGAGAYEPAIFDGIVSGCCVGEGERFLSVLSKEGVAAALSLPEAWVPGRDREVVPSTEYPWDMPPALSPDGVYRVSLSRGCRRKCLFCQTGWEAPYRVAPSVARQVKVAHELTRRGKKFAYISNDISADGVVDWSGAEFGSVSFKAMAGRIDGLPRTVRIGVEGVSERLRTAVGKPIGTTELVDFCARLSVAGRFSRLFFIAGLPGETDDDWNELDELLIGLARQDRGVNVLTFHAYIPHPASPLCVLPVVDEYWDREERSARRFFAGGTYSRRVQWIKPAQYATRLKNSMMSMACSDQELRRGWTNHDNPNWRVKYLANSEKMRAIARRYAERVGLVLPP